MTQDPVLREPPVAGTDIDTLLGSLERQRRTFAWKASGLTAEQMRARLEPSSLTIGGLVKHLALVEADYFSWRLPGRDIGAPWNQVDWDSDPDWEWRTAAADSPEELLSRWRNEVQRARRSIAEALSADGLDTPAQWQYPDGRTPTLRRFLLDVIEEYARHVGQLDLLRESVDGLVGEDPPESFSIEAVDDEEKS